MQHWKERLAAEPRLQSCHRHPMPFYVNIVKLGCEEAICGHVTSLPVLCRSCQSTLCVLQQCQFANDASGRLRKKYETSGQVYMAVL